MTRRSPLLGLPYIIKQVLGNTTGNIFLIDCGDRDLGVHARRDGVVHPAAVRDGA